jgi:carbon storage regulator CsrA
MLVIRCREGETLLIGDKIEVVVLGTGPGRVKFGINAPQNVRVVRKGVEITRGQNLASAQIGPAEMLRLIGRCFAEPRPDSPSACVVVPHLERPEIKSEENRQLAEK